MLTQTLRKLEGNGLIERDAPPYRLTELGLSLLSVVRALISALADVVLGRRTTVPAVRG